MWWFRGPSYFWGGVLVVIGVLILLGNTGVLGNINWDVLWPLLLIAFGAWLIAVRVLPGGGPAVGGSGAMDRADTRDGLAKARLEVAVGSARVEIRGAALGDQLYHARIGHRGQEPEVQLDRTTGTVRISQPGSWMMGGWGRVELDVQLSDALPWEVKINAGAIKGSVDLSTVPLTRFECDAGSSRLELSVPKPTGEVPIRVEGGSVKVRLRRPSGAAAKVQAAGGSISFTADGVRQGGFGNVTWQTPGLEAAADRYEAHFSGGSVRVDVDHG
jgi:hypothetical protein